MAAGTVPLRSAGTTGGCPVRCRMACASAETRKRTKLGGFLRVPGRPGDRGRIADRVAQVDAVRKAQDVDVVPRGHRRRVVDHGGIRLAVPHGGDGLGHRRRLRGVDESAVDDLRGELGLAFLRRGTLHEFDRAGRGEVLLAVDADEAHLRPEEIAHLADAEWIALGDDDDHFVGGKDDVPGRGVLPRAGDLLVHQVFVDHCGRRGCEDVASVALEDSRGQVPRNAGREPQCDTGVLRLEGELDLAHRACERIRMEDFEFRGHGVHDGNQQ